LHVRHATHAHTYRDAQAGRIVVVVSSSTMSIDSLPDDLLLRALAPLPLLRRLRASAACRRFKRLLYMPALRASLHRAHTLPQGESLAPGGALTSPDGRFRLVFKREGNVVLSHAAGGHAPGVDGAAVWALGVHSAFAPGRLALPVRRGPPGAGQLVAFDNLGHARWASWPNPARFAPPFRLVVRDEGDVAVLDADDAEVWVAPPTSGPPRGMDFAQLMLWTVRNMYL
jgi:hypothetical protein